MVEIDIMSMGINLGIFLGVIFGVSILIVVLVNRGGKNNNNDEADRNLIMFGDMDKMSGVDFERLLGLLLARKGYDVEFTPKTGDFGADLILTYKLQRIAVQAKRSKSPVGNSSVQEALAGAHYYNCGEAWVVTNNTFTTGGIKQAQSCSVQLFDRESVLDMQTEVRKMIENEEGGKTLLDQSNQNPDGKKYGILKGDASMEHCSSEKQEQSSESVHYGAQYIYDGYNKQKVEKKSKTKHKPLVALNYNIDECKTAI